MKRQTLFWSDVFKVAAHLWEGGREGGREGSRKKSLSLSLNGFHDPARAGGRPRPSVVHVLVVEGHLLGRQAITDINLGKGRNNTWKLHCNSERCSPFFLHPILDF